MSMGRKEHPACMCQRAILLTGQQATVAVKAGNGLALGRCCAWHGGVLQAVFQCTACLSPLYVCWPCLGRACLDEYLSQFVGVALRCIVAWLWPEATGCPEGVFLLRHAAACCMLQSTACRSCCLVALTMSDVHAALAVAPSLLLVRTIWPAVVGVAPRAFHQARCMVCWGGTVELLRPAWSLCQHCLAVSALSRRDCWGVRWRSAQ